MIAGSPSVGTVSFYIGSVSPGNQIGTAVNVSGGSATSASFSGLSPGSNTIIAVYSGGTGFAGSQGSATITGLTTLTWNGGANGNWTASHWSGTGPAFPVSYVNAIVNTPYIIQVTSTQSANSLSISGGGQVSVAAAANLSVAASTSVSGGSLVVASNGAFSTGGSLSLDAGGSISGGPITAGSYLINDGTASANLSGSGPLVKDTGGTVTLSGTNTYGGVTIVKLGTLVVSHPSSLPDGTNLIVGASAGTAFGSPIVMDATGPTVSPVTGSSVTVPSAPSLAAKTITASSTSPAFTFGPPTNAAAHDAVLKSGNVGRTPAVAERRLVSGVPGGTEQSTGRQSQSRNNPPGPTDGRWIVRTNSIS